MPNKSYHHVKFRKLFLSLTTAEKMPLSNLLLTNHYINQHILDIGWIALLVQHRTEKTCKGIFHCRLWTVCTAPRCNCIRSTDCVHVCVYACTYVYEFMCACECVCAHACMHMCVCVYISTHTHTNTHTHTHTLMIIPLHSQPTSNRPKLLLWVVDLQHITDLHTRKVFCCDQEIFLICHN